jgi:hypothetical protein
MCVGKKRTRCDVDLEEDESLYLVLASYTDHLSRMKSAFGVWQRNVEAVITSYVSFRGGLREIEVFEVPSVTFNPDSFAPRRTRTNSDSRGHSWRELV